MIYGATVPVSLSSVSHMTVASSNIGWRPGVTVGPALAALPRWIGIIGSIILALLGVPQQCIGAISRANGSFRVYSTLLF